MALCIVRDPHFQQYLLEKLTGSSNQVGSSLHAKEQLKGEGTDRLHLFGRGNLPLSYGASLCYC